MYTPTVCTGCRNDLFLQPVHTLCDSGGHLPTDPPYQPMMVYGELAGMMLSFIRVCRDSLMCVKVNVGIVRMLNYCFRRCEVAGRSLAGSDCEVVASETW